MSPEAASDTPDSAEEAASTWDLQSFCITVLLHSMRMPESYCAFESYAHGSAMFPQLRCLHAMLKLCCCSLMSEAAQSGLASRVPNSLTVILRSRLPAPSLLCSLKLLLWSSTIGLFQS